MRRRAAAFVVLVGAWALSGRAQTPAAIRGRVVAAHTGDPLRNARVIVKTTRDLPPLLTDADGRFSIDAPSTDHNARNTNKKKKNNPTHHTDDDGRFSEAATSGGQCTLSVAKAGYAKTTL